MTETAEIIDEQYKDCSPLATVERIKSILAENHIESQVKWIPSGVPYCYTTRVSVPGTTFQTNGKGLTEELALASGYGELIERLQIGFIYGPTSLKDGDFAIDDPKSELIPVRDLLSEDRLWYQRMAQVLLDSTGETITPEQMLNQCATKDGLVAVTPYFDLISSRTVRFPTVLRKRVYGSNGCAAGNTPEEALVQAISEVVERNHQIRIVKEGLALPDIPEEVLKNHKISYKIIDFVRNNGYKVCIKDASLNTGFPVVCACIIDQKTGRYHTHFGAHPVFEIALERALTESFQGRNIERIAKNEDFSKKSNEKFSLSAFYAELRRSSGNKLPGFFVDESLFHFDSSAGTTGDNRQILRFCMDYFSKRDLPLLVRDCSCLGFPTYQVLVPGYSEVYVNRISTKSDDQRYAPYAITTLRNPAKASIPDMMGLLMHLDRIRTLESSNSEIHSFSMLTKQPSHSSPQRQNQLKSAALGYVYYALGRYPEVIRCIGGIMPMAQGQDLEYLICLKRYLTMLTEGYTADYAHRVIAYFHSEPVVSKLQSILQSKKNPLDEFILKCDMQCTEACPLYGECCLKRVDALAARLDEKSRQLSFDKMRDYLRSIT
ncbi:MAG: YcaO-like family protein [Oscillospiraceae bacterium]|nr:YcaO-like family protein [Oscillospiraceae bacterium]